MKIKEGWEVFVHPNPEFMNLCVDCPLCGREEWFTVLRENKRQVVNCSQGGIWDSSLLYILVSPS